MSQAVDNCKPVPELWHDIPIPFADEPAPDEMGFCIICDVDIYLPNCRDFRCPQHQGDDQ